MPNFVFMFPFLLFPAGSADFSFSVYHALCRKAKPGVFHGFFVIHAGNRAIRAGFIDFFPQMRYIQSNPIFYGFTISFHHSKEVFVCSLIVSLRCVFWVALSIRVGGIDSPRPASQRAAALVLTAALLTGAAFPAFADTYYIEDGDITISAGKTEGTNKVSQGSTTDEEDTDTVITNNNRDTASSHTVTIDAGNDKVEVTLDNVNIKADSGSALTSNGDVTLTLKGENHLTGGNGDTYGGDGITSSGSLTISGGTVTATGGNNTGSDGSGGSGIYSVSGSVTISGGTVNATGGEGSKNNSTSGGSGIYSDSGDVTISGGTVNANGGNGGTISGGDGICSSGGVTISSGSTVTANGGSGEDGSGGRGITSNGGVTVSGGTVNAKGGSGKNGNGGDGILSFNPVAISGGTVKSNGGSGTISGGDGIRSLDHVAISGGTVKSNGGSGTNSGGYGIISNDIDLSGSLELTAKAGSPNGKALSRAGHEFDLDTIKDKLDPGAKVTTTDADGKVIQQVSIPRPVEPEKPVIPGDSSSSSGGGSADASVQESVFPGLVVTDKDGQRISYTSTQSGNTLTVCVGRFTASLRASLSTLRQLRAEGIETITFQTILCSTTLSVDELLAMGGEDTEVVLTHHIRSSTLTVNGKAV
jgi:hypothetical protein